MSKSVSIYCPQCNKRYRVAASLGHRTFRCRRCDHHFKLTDAEKSPANGDGQQVSVFDSLDVDRLLNAPSSGVGRAKKRRLIRKRRSKGTHRGPSTVSGHATDSASPARMENNPDPDLIESELRSIGSVSQQHPEGDLDLRPPMGSPTRRCSGETEFDEEELAIYRSVTRQNRWHNFLGAAIAMALVVLVGGVFARAEHDRLITPLTETERNWLTERGFVLQARRLGNPNTQKGAANVVVAAGKDFSNIDRFALDAPATQKAVAAEAAADRGGRNTVPIGAAKRRSDVDDQKQQTPIPAAFDTNSDLSLTAGKRTASIGNLSVPVELAAASADGGFYFSSQDRVFGIDGVGSIIEQRALDGPSGRVTAMVATSDRRRLILGRESGIVESYQIDAQGRLLQEFQLKHVHQAKILELRTSADSEKLVVYSADGRLTVWRLADQTIEFNKSDLVPQPRLQSLVLANEAVLIASAEGVRTVSLQSSNSTMTGYDQRYQLLVPGRSGRRIIFVDQKRLGVIDALTGQVVWTRTLRVHGDPVVGIAPDLQYGFYADYGRDVLQFDLSNGNIVDRFSDNRGRGSRQLKISSDGKQLLTFGNEEASFLYPVSIFKKFDRPEIKPPLPLPPRQYPPEVRLLTAAPPAAQVPVNKVVEVADVFVSRFEVSAACFVDDGYLLAADRDGKLVLSDWTRGRVVDQRFPDRLDGNDIDQVTVLAARGDQILTGRRSGDVQCGRLEPGGKFGSFRSIGGVADPIDHLGFIDGTTHVFAVGQTGQTRVWDSETGQEIFAGQPLRRRAISVAVDRRSDILFADGQALVRLDYKTAAVKTKKGDRRAAQVQLSPDGRRLAFLNAGKLNVATTRRGDLTTTSSFQFRDLKGLSFSPDSKIVCLVGENMVLAIRVRGGKELLRFPVPRLRQRKSQMIFSPDGKFMTLLSDRAQGRFKIYATPVP